MKKIIAIISTVIGVILLLIGAVIKVKKHMAISVIGGADGPTSVFLAGTLGDGVSLFFLTGGIAFVVAAVIMLITRRK